MIFKSGCYLISYNELSPTPEGLELWNIYMAQITEIALQYPNHFLTRTAKHMIPMDARRHLFYAYLRNERTIDAFCIAVVCCDQAELLWSASHEKRRGKMPILYRFIEECLFSEEPQVSKIIGMCATKDSFYKENNELIDGQKNGHLGNKSWEYTHRFHERMGYQFTHKMEDYWGEGAHAFVFMKLRDKRRYGYTDCKEFNFIPQKKNKLSDSQPSLNQQLYKTIVDYLDVFDENFVQNFAPETRKEYLHDNRLDGFTGIALFDCRKKSATLFAVTSTKSKPKASSIREMKFEYDIDASALTQILASESIKDDIGILHYPATWDNDSEISIKSYCKQYYPVLINESSFTIFFARHKGVNGHKSVLYFVTAEIENVVWYKPLWRAFAQYSFALVLELYSYFSSLLVLNNSLRGNDYFHSLIKAVSPIELSGSKAEFLNKIATMKDTMQKRIDAHYWAEVRSKESAIAHYGHTLGHRISPIEAFFEGNNESRKRAKANVKFLSDLSVVLQAINFKSREELYHHPKKIRFLEYERDNSTIDIIQKIQEEWSPLVESFQLARISAEIPQMRIMTLLEFTGNFKGAYLNFMLIDSENGEACRPNEAFYSQLFSELLLNIVRHGGIPKENYNHKDKIGKVRVFLTDQMLDHESKYAPSPCRTIILSNKIRDKVPPHWLCNSHWTPWPSNRDNSGPGMAIAILRQLRIGELWYRYIPTKRLFRVAIWLKGLYAHREEESER